jgi:hypothetical protein
MKEKLITLNVVVILILCGISTGFSEIEIKQEKKILSFSNLTIKENNDYISLELEGVDSFFMKKNHYMVPMFLETFTFPFGTKIINIKCTPRNIQRQNLSKELILGPEPFILNQNVMDIYENKITNPIAINSWYEYDIGTGISIADRCVFVKVSVFPIQYNSNRTICSMG